VQLSRIFSWLVLSVIQDHVNSIDALCKLVQKQFRNSSCCQEPSAPAILIPPVFPSAWAILPYDIPFLYILSNLDEWCWNLFKGNHEYTKRRLDYRGLLFSKVGSRIPASGCSWQNVFVLGNLLPNTPRNEYRKLLQIFSRWRSISLHSFYDLQVCACSSNWILCRVIVTLERTILLAFVLIPSRLRRMESTTSPIVTKPPASPTHRAVQMRNSWM
jgi:hypothetical protein